MKRISAALTGSALTAAINDQVRNILAGTKPAEAEAAASAAEGESETVTSIDDVQQILGRGPGARLRLLRVDNPGVEDGPLLERVGRGSVVVEQLTDADGTLVAVVLDDGTRVALDKPSFRRGLLVLTVDGDPQTKSVWKLLPPEKKLAALDRGNLDKHAVQRIEAHRELVASVARLAVTEASETKVNGPDELREHVDRHLAAVHHELAVYRKAAAVELGTPSDDPVIDELARHAHDVWRDKVQKMRWRMSEKQAAIVKSTGKPEQRLAAWQEQLAEIQESIEKQGAQI